MAAPPEGRTAVSPEERWSEPLGTDVSPKGGARVAVGRWQIPPIPSRLRNGRGKSPGSGLRDFVGDQVNEPGEEEPAHKYRSPPLNGE